MTQNILLTFGAVLLMHVIPGHASQGTPMAREVLDQRIPVTSQMIDLGDDPETKYSGAPQFDWSFFGGQTRLIAKYPATMPAHRHTLGIDYRFYMIETDSFTNRPVWYVEDAMEDKPAVPTIIFANIRKINNTAEDNERALAYDLNTIKPFLQKYPHLIFGGGEVAEVDAIFDWQYKQYYGRLPVGAGGAVFPAAYFDFLESNLKRSSVPYMLQQHNRGWGTHYVARERIMSLGSAQLFYRHNQVIVPSLTSLRSAARQYPFPFGVQFSGQLNLAISNEDAVLKKGAKPIYTHATGRLGSNYEKSYALCRQVLYLSWLNGARFFNWETGELIRVKKELIPSPLGTFTARAAKLIEGFGPTGPVQTPIALISEFSNAWRPPATTGDKHIKFTIVGDAPYAPGDYQMHGIRDFFFSHYLQSEMIYEDTMVAYFSIGNVKLHYVVTRPRDGNYVIGIFNDSLKSEPFKITSNIGPITSMVETDLMDNKDELKAVVGGAAYAPPGLRNSSGLPLDYGLSDAANIEGRDFRLFRITVKERGVCQIPAIKFPSRPVGRVLAVAGLENIRGYLQGISMFFTWFDGVKVDAGAFLSLEDSWLVEQAHWLDRQREEDLHQDLARFASGGNAGELQGKRNSTSLYSTPKVEDGTANDFFYVGPYISDLTDLLVRYREDFHKFAGIKIDSSYLLSKNLSALERDRAALTNSDLRVIVDLRRDQMHFDRITFYPHIPNYKTGMMLYSQIIDKMKAIGAIDLIVQISDAGEMRGKEKYIEQRDRTWGEFVREAGQKGINLHLVCSKEIIFSSVAAFNRPNVVVIVGAKGTPSPYQLVLPSGSTGKGTTKIYDANWCLDGADD